MRGVRRTASLALVLALAAPVQLPAFAQDVGPPADAGAPPDVSGQPDVGAQPDAGAQKGDDAVSTAPPSGEPATINKTDAASAPTDEARPEEAPRVNAEKLGEKGMVGEASAAPAAGAPADAADGPPSGPSDGDDAVADAATGEPAAASGLAAGADAAVILAAADVDPHDRPDGLAAQLADWVRGTHDNGKRPYAVIDKLGARIYVFAHDGTLMGAAPVLVGLAHGDDSASGIGDKALAAISPDERTTPAGRFVARFGPAAGNKTVLWVDYADAISLHPVITTNPKEHRLKRIKSETAEDHRISFGCINVPASFYEKVVATSFRKRGGVVYILPDTRPVWEVFPAFAATMRPNAEAAPAGEAAADAAAQSPSPLGDDPQSAERLGVVPPGADALAVSPAENDPLATDPPAPAADPQPAAAAPPADDPDQPIATQVASQPAADGAKHSRHGGKHRAAHPATATPA